MKLLLASKLAISVVTLSLLSGCGEIIIGTGCILDSASHAFRSSTKLDLPVARIGQRYQEKIQVGTDGGFGFEKIADNLPAGLTAELLQHNPEHNQWASYTFPHTNNGSTIWLQVSGTPEQAGHYTVKLSNTSRPSMCGSSVSYYQVRLNVEKAE